MNCSIRLSGPARLSIFLRKKTAAGQGWSAAAFRMSRNRTARGKRGSRQDDNEEGCQLVSMLVSLLLTRT